MIEFILLYLLCRHIGNEADKRGMKRWPFQLMAVSLWFIGELLGGLLAVAVMGSESLLVPYGVGLAAAGLTTVLALRMVRKAGPVLAED